ncbi:MAG: hypothetical protein GC149_15250 [Gammaproteobacteria bacterium]|nr:hypothetical protein [Gammaproteobacteria bacterium]
MLKQFLTDTWYFFKNHLVAISMIVLPIVIPVEILSTIYRQNYTGEEFVLAEQLPPLLLGFVVYPIYTAGIVFYLHSVIVGKGLNAQSAWLLGVRFWFPYVLLSMMMGAAIIFGIFLFILPGIFFAIRFAFAEFDLLLNRTSPADAMKNSWALTKDYMWVILGGYVIITLILFTPYYVIAKLLDPTNAYSPLLDTTANIVYAVLEVSYMIFAFRIYDHARKHLSPSSA